MDYPELRSRMRDVVKIARAEEMTLTRGGLDSEFIWYAGGPDNPDVLEEFSRRQWSRSPFSQYSPFNFEVAP